MGLTSADYLSLIYAFAGLLGGFLNVRASGRPWRSREALTTYVSGFIMGGAWLLYPLIDFDPKTALIPRVMVVGAIAFVAADVVRNQILKRFGLFGADAPAPPAPPKGDSTMRSLLVAVLMVAVVFTSGCGLAGITIAEREPGLDLKGFVKKDVTGARDRALKASDAGAPFRARCYDTMLKYLAPEPVPGQGPAPVIGLVDGFELAAEKLAEQASGGGLLKIPEDLQANCGYLVDEIRRFTVRAGLKLAPLPGAGAAGSLLPR